MTPVLSWLLRRDKLISIAAKRHGFVLPVSVVLFVVGVPCLSLSSADPCNDAFAQALNIDHSFYSRLYGYHFNDLGREIDFDKIDEILRSTLANWDNSLQPSAAHRILVDAYQNTIQHGKRDPVGAGAVFVKTTISLNDSRAYFKIRSPQVKPFPESLQGYFFPGDSVEVPRNQRSGFRGNGIAHGRIFEQLENLPSGSYVYWGADGQFVTFGLSISR